MKFSVVRILAAALLLSLSAQPARADSITIDSTNCQSSNDCFGLSWTLTIDTQAAGYTHLGINYDYKATLDVKDDIAIAGTPNVTISAVDFKVSSSVGAAVLYSVPTSTLKTTWYTSIHNLSSGGCTDSGANFVCSQSATDPANFVASAANQTWVWLFDAETLLAGLDGAHIGAKLVPLNQPGRLLSQEFHRVPEPGSLALLAIGAGIVAVGARRRERRR